MRSSVRSRHKVAIKKPLQLAGYQAVALDFIISLSKLGIDAFEYQFSVKVLYQTAFESSRSQRFQVNLEVRCLSDSQRFTYLYPSRMVSYAILWLPPLDPCSYRPNRP